jgi:hypothetical protein
MLRVVEGENQQLVDAVGGFLQVGVDAVVL